MEKNEIIKQYSGLFPEFGTFLGFNCRTQTEIGRPLNAAEVLLYDHAKDGETEFWPSGDCPGMALLFPNTVTGADIFYVRQLFDGAGGDSDENYLKLHHAMNVYRRGLRTLTKEILLKNDWLHITIAESSDGARENAARSLFFHYHPAEFSIWEKSECPGLIFDSEAFLNSRDFGVEEVKFGSHVAILAWLL